MPIPSSSSGESAEPAPRYSLSAVPPAPRAMSPAARRIVGSWQGGSLVLILVGTIFLGTGLILSTVFCWSLPVDLTLALSGVPLQGVVVSAEADLHAKVNGVHPTLVRYRYRTPAGTFEDDCDVMGEEYRELAPGAPIALEVSSLRPQWSRVAGSTYGFFGYFGSFTLLFPTLGAVLTAFAIRQRRRALRAYRDGRPVMATVVGSGPNTMVRVNGRNPYRVSWEFRLPDGSVHHGSAQSMRTLELEPYGKAGTVPVLYDPEDPSNNTLFVP